MFLDKKVTFLDKAVNEIAFFLPLLMSEMSFFLPINTILYTILNAAGFPPCF